MYPSDLTEDAVLASGFSGEIRLMSYLGDMRCPRCSATCDFGKEVCACGYRWCNYCGWDSVHGYSDDELARWKRRKDLKSPCKNCGHHPHRGTSIVEIGVEVSSDQLSKVLRYMRKKGIPYYVEPPAYYTLEELEATCKGK